MKTIQIALVGIICGSISLKAQHEKKPVAEEIAQLLDDYLKLGPEVVRSTVETAKAFDIVTRLNQLDHHLVLNSLFERIVDAKPREGQTRKLAWLLVRLEPSCKGDLLVRVQTEPDPHRKINFASALESFRGNDVTQVLVTLLDDKRVAQIDGGSVARAMRLCDYAFNLLYRRLRKVPGLALDQDVEFKHPIVNDTPLDWRDARIAKLKAVLLKRYGTELKIEDQD